MTLPFSSSRSQFVTGLASSTAPGSLSSSAYGRAIGSYSSPKDQGTNFLVGSNMNLSLGHILVNFTGKNKWATAINGSVPGPTLIWKEGDLVTINVQNNMAVDSSIHWHGMILPSNMDGVPGLSFAGIKPGQSYKYQFQVSQSGTYWYHSHSGFQEQTGLYGAIVIQPKAPSAYSYDRDYVVMLSDWSDEDPNDIYANLKRIPHIYNTNECTLADLCSDAKQSGLGTL